MLSFLKKHPFAVDACFESSVVLTYAVPVEELNGLLPECLTADTFNEEWAFIAVAMVQTKNLRPSGFPTILGNDFFLIGYRIFVRYTTNAGKRLRGLYILGSEANRPKMVLLGNIFTHYHYSLTDVVITRQASHTHIRSNKSGLDIELEVAQGEIQLPSGSPFSNWKEARRFAGPLPFTFTYNLQNREVLIIEGVREHWDPQPLLVAKSRVAFIEKIGFKNASLASAFIVRNIPYHWKKGRTEIWKG